MNENEVSNSKIDFINESTMTVATLATVKLTHTYISQRMLELGLTKNDIRGEMDPELALDEIELQEIRNNKQLFDIWVKHVHRHKQLKAFELAKKQQAEEYDLGDRLECLSLEHQFKFIDHVLTTFKKFFLGERYIDQKPTDLFVEIWFKANYDLTIGQIFEASVELIRLSKFAKDNYDNAKIKRLEEISNNAEYFRKFCVEGLLY